MENINQLIFLAILITLFYFIYQKKIMNDDLSRPKFIITPQELQEQKAIVDIVGGPYASRLELFFSGPSGAINENSTSDLNTIIFCINKMTPHHKYITARYILNIIESYTIAAKNESKIADANEYTDIFSTKYEKFIKPWIFPLTRLRDNMSHDKKQIQIDKELGRIGFINMFFGKLTTEQRMFTQIAPPPTVAIAKQAFTTHNFTTA